MEQTRETTTYLGISQGLLKASMSHCLLNLVNQRQEMQSRESCWQVNLQTPAKIMNPLIQHISPLTYVLCIYIYISTHAHIFKKGTIAGIAGWWLSLLNPKP